MNLQLFFLPTIILSFVVFMFMLMKVCTKPSSSTTEDSSLSLPPGPRKLPFIGNLHLMVCTFPHHRLRDLGNKYGPLMHLKLGDIPTLVVSSPEMASQVMKTHDINFANRPYFHIADVIFYGSTNIALSPYGDYWRQLRKFITVELLSNKKVKEMESIRDNEVSKFTKTISLNARSKINLTKMLACLNYDIIAKAAFGGISEKNRAFMTLQDEINELFARGNLVDIFPSVKLFQLMSQMRPKIKRLHHKVDKVLNDIIDECRTRKAPSDLSNEAAESFLDIFLRLKEHEDFQCPLSWDNIKAVILDVFIAGIETTTTTLEWVMSELIKNPTIMQKAQAEVREVFNGKEGKIKEADFEQLKFMRLVIKETIRLHPPVPFLLPRVNTKKCEINGYDIGENTQVIINAWAIGRDPNSWTEPEKFYPERFIHSSIDYRGNDFELIPFGAGRRICPGMLFGIASVEIILANLLYYFDWLLPHNKRPEDLEMTELFGTTTRRKYNLCLLPIPYKVFY